MGAPRLLIVDDEAPLLDLLRRYLVRLNYEVETAGTAEEALALFKTDPARFALVITDLTLDDINGEDLLEQMRQLKPGLPGLIASGYPHEPRLKHVDFLLKPFLPSALVSAVERALKKKRD
jgi:DNA-binding NtrC family response regulator